eukprot:s3132_g2.t1
MVGEATAQALSQRKWFSSHWVKGSQGVLRIPGSRVSQHHAEQLLAELGREQLWQDALHLFHVFKDQRLQPSSSTYEAVARGVQRSWPCSLQVLDLQRTEAMETQSAASVGLPQIARSLRLGGQWPFSLQLLTHAKEHVLRRDQTLIEAFWAASEACFQHLEEQGCWLIALRLLADLSRNGLWESASRMNRENVATSTIGACAVEGQWQLALSLACGPLEASIGSPALQHVLRACAEAEAWEVSLQLLRWTVGSTYTTSHGKEMKLEIRQFKDSEDDDTHTVLQIGEYQLREDDENNRDFANQTFSMKGPEGEVSYGDKRCRGSNWNHPFMWKKGSAFDAVNQVQMPPCPRVLRKELGEMLKTLADSEEVTVEELISALPWQFNWFLKLSEVKAD